MEPYGPQTSSSEERRPQGVELLGTMRGDTGKRDGDCIVLTDSERIQTSARYTPPVEFRVIAQTDSTNLRLGYCAEQIIFNWEREQPFLRIDGGPADGHHKRGQGQIRRNQWVEISLVTLPNELIIRVDGVERHRVKADFSRINEPLSIFQYGPAVIKVRSVRVLPPAEPEAGAQTGSTAVPRHRASDSPPIACPMPAAQGRRFLVALTFPGERRDYVKQVAGHLAATMGRNRVLYDHFHEAEFARPDLNVYLPKLYLSESHLVCVFLCAEYSRKQWCRLEWRYIHQLIGTGEQRRIMFLSFDDLGPIPELGILAGDGYVAIRSRPASEIADLIQQRLSLTSEDATCVKQPSVADATKPSSLSS